MFLSLFRTLRQRHALQQTLGALQRRADDRLLDDIGLIRDDLRTLISNPPAPDARTVRRARLVMQKV